MKSSTRLLIRLYLRSHDVNQELIKTVESVVFIYALKRPVLSCIIVIIPVYKLVDAYISIFIKSQEF